jgi:hypothetical protein
MSNELTAEELAELTADVRSAMPNWTLPMRAEKVSKILAALRARDEEIGRLRHSASYWQSEAERYAATIGARDERIAELERALLRKDAECKAGRECVGTRMIHETPMLVLEVNDRIGDPKIAGLHDARRRCDELEQP